MRPLNKDELKKTVYKFWREKLKDEYIEKEYFLQLKRNDNPNKKRLVAGWAKGIIITLNLNTIEKMNVSPEVVLAHEYGHLINQPIENGIMNENGNSHIGKELKDYVR